MRVMGQDDLFVGRRGRQPPDDGSGRERVQSGHPRYSRHSLDHRVTAAPRRLSKSHDRVTSPSLAPVESAGRDPITAAEAPPKDDRPQPKISPSLAGLQRSFLRHRRVPRLTVSRPRAGTLQDRRVESYTRKAHSHATIPALELPTETGSKARPPVCPSVEAASSRASSPRRSNTPSPPRITMSPSHLPTQTPNPPTARRRLQHQGQRSLPTVGLAASATRQHHYHFRIANTNDFIRPTRGWATAL